MRGGRREQKMDGAPFMPGRQLAIRDLREHSRTGEIVSNSEFVNSLLVNFPSNTRTPPSILT